MTDMKCDRKKGRLISFHGNNGGSSIVLVVVVMFVVMLLGLAIMYSSYTAVVLRSSQRKSERTFTSAETGMDLIKEGLSEINSDAMAVGYKEMLSGFSKNQDVNNQTFLKAYMSEIVRYGKGNSLFPEADTEFNGKVTITKYNIKALDAYLKGRNKEGSNYTLSAIVNGKPSDKGIGIAHITKNNNIVIRGVRLVYKKDGYEEQVTTDFLFTIPETNVGYTHKGFDSALDNYNFVADKGVVLYRLGEPGHPVSSTFAGSGYAGSVVVAAGGPSFNSDGSVNMASSGGLVVNDGQELVIGKTRVKDDKKSDAANSFVAEKRGNEDKRTSGNIIFATGVNGGVTLGKGSTLWTNGIQLKKDNTLWTGDNSHIYIRNDLEFTTGGRAILKGSYYGFGNGKSFDGTTTTNSPSDSSSIIFNAKGMLDIFGIQSLTLAGHSFVTESSTNTGKNAGMGSSVTTRPEQTAYLLPESFMNSISDKSSDSEVYSNPRIISASSDEANNVSKDKALASISNKKFKQPVDGLSKTLYDYGIVNKTKIKVLTYNVPGNSAQCVRYYFLDFGDDQDNANAYFKDYFNNNQEQINTYISSYADLIGFDTKGASIRSAGTTFEGAKGRYTVTGGGNVTTDEANSYNKFYKNLSETLTTQSEGETTPFYHFINVKKLHELCGKRTPNTENATETNCVTVPLQKHVYYDKQNHKDVIVKAFWGDLAIGGSSTADGKKFSGGGIFANGYNAYVVDGDVLLSGNFSGIIMCSGTLYISVSDRFKVENLGIEALRETPLWGGKKPSEPQETQWEDVTYENWKKD